MSWYGYMNGSSQSIDVLLVDDDSDVGDIAKTYLERADDRIDVQVTTSPTDALTIISAQTVDCIVADQRMPHMSGIEFLEAVREDYSHLPFILYTGKGSEDVASKAIRAGVSDYLQKESSSEHFTTLANRITNLVSKTRAEQEVKLTREYFSRILNHASDYVLIVTDFGEVQYASPAVERVMGYSPDKLVGTDAFEFVHPDDRSRATETFAKLLSNSDEEQSVVIEYRARDAEGSWKWIEVRGRNLLDDDVIEGILVNVRDISERKERELELARNRERFESLFNSIRDAIVVADPDLQIIECNPAFTDLFGYSLDEIRGEPTTILYDNETDYNRLGDMLSREDIDAKSPETVPYKMKSGQTFPGETTISQLRDEDGDLMGFIGLIRDISERNERLQQIKVIDRVLRHNLKNDMNIILGHSDLIQNESDGEVVTHAEMIAEKGEQLLELADNERKVTKFLADRPSRVSTDVVRVIETAVETSRSRHPNAEISVSVPDEQSVSAVGQFRIALEELIENAIIHSDREAPSVTVALDRDGKMVEIHIADTGPGIPEMERRVLTQEDELTPLNHGSGFGLWLVNLVVKHSRGTLDVTDNDPRGTIVTVRLPVS